MGIPVIAMMLLFVSPHACGKGSKLASDFNTLEAAVSVYKLTSGVLPDPELGLQSLVSRPACLPEDAGWSKLFNEIPSDPWGEPYIYVAGGGYPGGFGFYSTGPDGISASQGNDPDDLNSWSDTHRGIGVGLGRHWRRTGLVLAGTAAISFLLGHLVGRNRKNVEEAP